MLVIPIGQENGEVRREPWVSYGIVAFNVLIFVFLWFASNASDVPAKFEAQARVVTDYLIRNPYLTVPPEMTAFYGRPGLQLLDHAKAASATPDAWIVRRQQQKLNSMARELFTIGRELPLLKPGFIPAEPDAFAALSSLFVHASLLHLLGNMIFFFATGPFLEDVLGRVLFTALYLFSGVAALAVHTWQNPGSLAPVVGASGAIAGIMGAFLIRLRTSRIRMLFVPIILLPWVRFRFLVPAFVFLPLWFIGQFWLATNLDQGGPSLCGPTWEGSSSGRARCFSSCCSESRRNGSTRASRRAWRGTRTRVSSRRSTRRSAATSRRRDAGPRESSAKTPGTSTPGGSRTTSLSRSRTPWRSAARRAVSWIST